MKRFWYGVLLSLLVFSLLPHAVFGKKQDQPDVELWNALKPLDTTVTFLNTGAHPDDERSDLLAYLSRGLGIKTASLIANRGEGGQNAIGNELGNGLGIIRSNEMIEAAKVNGVKAYHLSDTTSDAIYDFGFSKSPEETLEKWGEDVTYSRLIEFIRTYQPDVVMPSFLNVDSQHGHHRAINILTMRAFHDAADPAVYPEQIENGLKPWQIKKLYLPVSETEATVSLEIGDYDPIYGMSYPQLGEASRYLHKSQGMGRNIPVEPRQAHLKLAETAVQEESGELFDGIPYDFDEWADEVIDPQLSKSLRSVQRKLEDIFELYPDREAILPESQKALRDMRKLVDRVASSKLDREVKNDLLHKIESKEEQLSQVSLVASELSVDVRIGSQVLTQGEQTEVEVTVTNEGSQKVHHVEAALLAAEGWKHEQAATLKHLNPGESKTATFTVEVPGNARYFEPYAEAVLRTKLTFKQNGVETESVHNLENTVSVLPELGVTPDPVNVTVNTVDVQDEIPVTVKVKNYAGSSQQANVSLNLPKGWTAEPAFAEVNFNERFEEQTASFTLIPPSDIEEGEFTIEAIAEADGQTFNTTVQEIKYEHIQDAYHLYPASINGVAFEMLKPESLQVGYIDSGFDTMADSLVNAGFDITKLTPEDLASADLSQYDTIVAGIRSTLGRQDLLENNERIKEYVRNGGHFVMQYVTAADPWDAELTPPYRLKIGTPSIRWRVTDENSVVTMTKPDHRLFNYPNKITDRDWEGWVQERGLYFPMEWDERYETFVSMADPGEDPFTGGILMAEYGKGTYLYTNLVFYRQIGAQVPGGYRIFANLISYGTRQ